MTNDDNDSIKPAHDSDSDKGGKFLHLLLVSFLSDLINGKNTFVIKVVIGDVEIFKISAPEDPILRALI